MAVQDSTTLKGYFNTGDVPTESQFADLIDTVDSKQATLVSATTIKTINNTSLLGPGNIVIEGGGADIPYQNDAPSNPSDGDLWVDKDATATGSASLLVAETVVSGSAVTSVTFSGLDGNAAGGYVLVSNGQLISSDYIRLYINGDTTNTHYYTQGIQSYTNNVSVGWNNVNDTNIVYSNGDYQIILNIDIVANKLRAYCLANTESPEGFLIYNVAVKGTQTLTNNNITSITLVSGASNIAVGSKSSLYRRK